MEAETKLYPFSTNHLPGTWKGLKTPDGREVSFTCPLCGRIGSLVDHQIAEDGTVSPSVVCSYDDCTFHEFIRLEEWRS